MDETLPERFVRRDATPGSVPRLRVRANDRGRIGASLADAELAEDAVQQIIRVDGPHDCPEFVEREA